MEEAGIITSYGAQVDPGHIGQEFAVPAFIPSCNSSLPGGRLRPPRLSNAAHRLTASRSTDVAPPRGYDAKGRARMGRAVKQVLLLHMNYLNSLYLDDLLQRFRDDGWSFITFAEALKDEVYKLKYDYVGVRGAGHLDAIKPSTR